MCTPAIDESRPQVIPAWFTPTPPDTPHPTRGRLLTPPAAPPLTPLLPDGSTPGHPLTLPPGGRQVRCNDRLDEWEGGGRAGEGDSGRSGRSGCGHSLICGPKRVLLSAA